MSAQRDISEIFDEGTEIDRALARAAASARREHKLLGFPIVVWQNGRVVVVPPEEIVVGDIETHEGDSDTPR